MFDPEPWLPSISEGTLVSLTGKAWYFDEAGQGYKCTSLLHGQPFLLRGSTLTTERFAVIGATVSMVEGLPHVETHHAALKEHFMVYNKAATEVIDACSGYGIMTAGYKWIDCTVRCHIELNPKYATWLRSTGANVIEGDIASIAVQKALVPYTCMPCILTGGFACQPFSQLGDKRQQLDPRAKSFEGMLITCYLHQPIAMILERTKEAMTSTWVQGTLNAFCNRTGYTFQQQLCHLQDLWPAKRSRWWGVLVHPMVTMPPLRRFPALDFVPSFRHLIPKLAEWPAQDLTELQLTAHELEVFAEQPGGLGSNSVSPTRPLMTALHAWGSQLQACACGCRAGGFTTKRLEEKGLYGALIPMPGTTKVRRQDIANMRHVHPDEVAILHMVPTRYIHQGDTSHLRLDLTALGQMASPAHALWHVAQVIQALGTAFGLPVHPMLAEQGLLQLGIETFAARDEMLKPFTHTRGSSLFQTAYHAKFGSQHILPTDDDLFPAEAGLDNRHQGEGGNKRKGAPGIEEDHDTDASQGITPTGGLEFFANRPHRTGSTQVIIPAVGHSAGTSSHMTGSHEDYSAIRRPVELGDKKIVHPVSPQSDHPTGGPRFAYESPAVTVMPQDQLDDPDHQRVRTDLKVRPDFALPPETTEQSGILSSSREKESLEAIDQERVNLLNNNDLGKLVPTQPFLITVCSKGANPVEVRVRPGSTTGQLSKAEEGIESLVQPIVITTMTGTPSPLASWLTPGAWCIVDNGATHSVPRCADIHAQQECVLTIQAHDRLQGLLVQGPLVAVDEMTFYAAMIRNQGHNVADPIVIDSSDQEDQALATWVLTSLREHEITKDRTLFQVPVLVRSHWVPVALRITSAGNRVTVPQEVMSLIQDHLVADVGPHELEFEASTLPSAFHADCGFQTVNCIFAQTIGTDKPKPILPAQADNWRVLFAVHAKRLNLEQAPSIRVGGTMHPDQVLLQALLAQHGVHKERLATCAINLIQQLGGDEIGKALKSPQPWKDLKTLASQASPPIRIVLAAEVDAAVKDRLATKKPFGSKANKTKGHRGTRPQVIPTADQIKLPDSLFVQQDGQKLPSIPVHKVEAHAQGVAVCNIQDALHFLSLTSPLSAEGVALLILDHADPRLPPQVEQIRVPAMSAATSEPMLVSAAMLQLGNKRVLRHVPAESFALDEIQTQVLKVVVYQDEWTSTWSSFLQHPVKAIFDHPVMQDAEIPQAENVMDVWDRQTLDSKLTRTQPQQAEIFAVLIRVTSRLADHLLPSAGVDGVYFEPRTMDGRRPDPQFRVVWMPKKNLAQVRLARSQTEAKTHIVRMGQRYGLRVHHEHAEQVHHQHRPDLLFLDGQALRPYKVGPFPYGSTKASISMAFKHLGWQARPVQPISQMQVQDGIFWQVMAPHEPTHWI